jgi:DNA polymerase
VEVAIDAFKCGIAGDLYEDLNSVASSCLRGAIIAPDGKKLVVADLSNIEGRVLAWAAGERWKLQAFREYDAGTGPDLYKKTYARTFGTTPEAVDKKQRQIGKVLELGMGYGGGASAFIAYGQGLNLDFSSVADNAERALDPAILEKATANYQFFIEQGRDLSHINKRWFIAIEAVKIAWRSANKEIVSLWDRLAVAACSVLRGETRSQKIGPVVIDKDSGYLRVRLPSGRYMCYPAAIALTDRTLKYFGANQITKKWGYIETYGGKITENVIQAIARDVLVSSMQPAEDAGYKVVLSVHDELITETEDSPAYTEKGLAKIMSTAPVWAEGLPLSAAGFEGYRYRKD